MTQGPLSATEEAVLDAVLDRLVPGGPHGAGAREANVLRYIKRRLGGPYAHHIGTYVTGLARLDAEAATLHGRSFVTLGVESREALLRAAEARTGDPFFEVVLTHAMEGMFGDPSHGGNADLAGWELIGYPGPRYEWTEGDQQLERIEP